MKATVLTSRRGVTKAEAARNSVVDPGWFARSGSIYDDQESRLPRSARNDMMYIDVSGPGTVQFSWKVSSQRWCDCLKFTVDGGYRGEISGDRDWEQETYTLTGAGPHRLQWRYYKDSSDSEGDDRGYVKAVTFTPPPLPTPDPLAEAVDLGLVFTTGGLGYWQRQTGSPSYYDGDCAQSAATSDNDEAWMETTVEGAGTLTFWWKVSSESGCDFLEFYLDNQLQSGHISGEVDWTQKSYTITGAGPHTLKWRYVKDGSSSFGDDCGWVDWVQWTGSLPPAPPAEPLRFYLDGVESYGCRTGDWEQKSYTITGSGTHTLRWLFGRYTQDWSGTGYVDDVQWTGYIPQPPAPPAEPLRFYIDGVESYGCRTGSWEQKSYTITGSGVHTLRWLSGRYTPDWSGTGYVDKVQWTGSMPPAADAWGTVNYLYDSSGRRIEKRIDGRTITKYIYDGDHCLAEYDASGNLRRKYIYGPGVDQPICMIEATQSYAGTYYYHFDALGSVVALTNSSGNTVEVYEYDVYGRVGASDPNHPNRFMFTGREYDKETGLYYYRARYYNPQIGRFLQIDPVGYGNGMNWYAYCGNGPATRSDPRGLSWEDGSIRIVFYNGAAVGAETGATMQQEADDPYFDLAIDMSKVRMAALLQGHNLLDLIMDKMPSLPGDTRTLGPGPKLYKREDVHIEGVWILDHGNVYDGNCMNPMMPGNEDFTAFFQQLGAALDNNNGKDATINLRGCQSAVPIANRGSPAEAAAKASGHTTTGALGDVWHGESPWGKNKGPLYYCNEGYMAFTPQFNSDGSATAPWPHPCDDYHTSSTWIYDSGYNPSNSSGYAHSHYVYQNDVWMY